MLSVSNQCKNEFIEGQTRRWPLFIRATIKRKNNVVINLTEDDFAASSENYISEDYDGTSFPLGVVFSKTLHLDLITNKLDRLPQNKEYYKGCEISLQVLVYLNDTHESSQTENGHETIEYGTYIIADIQRKKNRISITACDRTALLDKAYAPSGELTEADNVFFQIVENCNVPIDSSWATAFDSVEYLPVLDIHNLAACGYTCREIVGAIAMLLSGNARMSYDGKLHLMRYDSYAFNKKAEAMVESENYNVDLADYDFGILHTRCMLDYTLDDTGFSCDWLRTNVTDVDGVTYTYTSAGSNTTEGTKGLVLTNLLFNNGDVAQRCLNQMDALMFKQDSELGLSTSYYTDCSATITISGNPLYEILDPICIFGPGGSDYRIAILTSVRTVFTGATILEANITNGLVDENTAPVSSISDQEAKSLIEKAFSQCELTENKVTEIADDATDTEYPSAAAVLKAIPKTAAQSFARCTIAFAERAASTTEKDLLAAEAISNALINMNANSGAAKVQKSGLYMITTRFVRSDANNVACNASLYDYTNENTLLTLGPIPVASSRSALTQTVLVYLNKGDQIAFRVITGSGTATITSASAAYLYYLGA